MISRHWEGIFKTEYADDYVRHLREDLFPKLSSIEGFMNASILRRDMAEVVEFLIITKWDSMEAIKKFAGDAPELAVVPIEVQRMTLSFDTEVRHYEIVQA